MIVKNTPLDNCTKSNCNAIYCRNRQTAAIKATKWSIFPAKIEMAFFSNIILLLLCLFLWYIKDKNIPLITTQQTFWFYRSRFSDWWSWIAWKNEKYLQQISRIMGWTFAQIWRGSWTDFGWEKNAQNHVGSILVFTSAIFQISMYRIQS